MSTTAELLPYTQASTTIDSTHPEICALAQSLTSPGARDIENAISLYYWCRDEVRYNPYAASAELDDYLASKTLAAREGWCVTKAILLAALCRAVAIPARLGFADVRNHLSTADLRAAMTTDIFYFHGYTAIYLEGQWVKATPAFNLSLCERFGLQPLEFNGREDSIFHAFDETGNRHMEYLKDRGQSLDLPFTELMDTFSKHYPGMLEKMAAKTTAQKSLDHWEQEVEQENARA
ncbi:transglutaminase family protein [Halioglobus maricola]|uniref:Transglutaminase family protein n=1 Tax=Halioglobus maricola TaxID=2601894 RepID=A0A5P9NK35_9GAMM|nr:transglutaminase family protein [Halioglobus maricola]QFU75846.1 transglutaminase family protein [Halioglobus maricola]